MTVKAKVAPAVNAKAAPATPGALSKVLSDMGAKAKAAPAVKM